MLDGEGLFEADPAEKKRPRARAAAMDKRFRAFDPRQALLLPPSLGDWLPEDHLARFVADLVDQALDLAPILADYTEKRGYPPYDPRLMVRLLIYGYTTGVRSSRAIERKCVDDVAFRFLSADQAPDFRSIARFRRRHLDALADLFLQSLHLAQKLGMVKMSRVDGKEVDLPAELSRREKRLARLQAARAQIEAEAADKARRHAEDKERRRQRRAGKSDEQAVTDADEQAAANARPKPKAQADFTDPDSRIMKNSDGAYIQAYNAQAVVDEQHQVITAADVTTNASDALKYAIMLDQSAANTGTHPKQALVDAGYCSETNLEAAQDRQLSCGTDTFMATGRLGHDEQVPPAPRGRPGPPALSAASRADRISPRAADTGRAATSNLDEYNHSVSCRLLRHAPSPQGARHPADQMSRKRPASAVTCCDGRVVAADLREWPFGSFMLVPVDVAVSPRKVPGDSHTAHGRCGSTGSSNGLVSGAGGGA